MAARDIGKLFNHLMYCSIHGYNVAVDYGVMRAAAQCKLIPGVVDRSTLEAAGIEFKPDPEQPLWGRVYIKEKLYATIRPRPGTLAFETVFTDGNVASFHVPGGNDGRH